MCPSGSVREDHTGKRVQVSDAVRIAGQAQDTLSKSAGRKHRMRSKRVGWTAKEHVEVQSGLRDRDEGQHGPVGNHTPASESVRKYHPHKLAQVSDAVLDVCLTDDPKSKVTCATQTQDNMVVLGNPLTSGCVDKDRPSELCSRVSEAAQDTRIDEGPPSQIACSGQVSDAALDACLA